jgi:hypothetical protein
MRMDTVISQIENGSRLTDKIRMDSGNMKTLRGYRVKDYEFEQLREGESYIVDFKALASQQVQHQANMGYSGQDLVTSLETMIIKNALVDGKEIADVNFEQLRKNAPMQIQTRDGAKINGVSSVSNNKVDALEEIYLKCLGL